MYNNLYSHLGYCRMHCVYRNNPHVWGHVHKIDSLIEELTEESYT